MDEIFLDAQGYESLPIILHQDNMSLMTLAEKGRSTSERTHCIQIRYFWIHDYIDRGDIFLLHCPTEEMIADFFTKPLQGELFIKHRYGVTYF